MIALLIGTLAMAGVGVGWYGHKARLRIDTWGKHANERDLIFQAISQDEYGGELRTGMKRTNQKAAGAPPLINPHFR